MDIEARLKQETITSLKEYAKQLGIPYYYRYRKEDKEELISLILKYPKDKIVPLLSTHQSKKNSRFKEIGEAIKRALETKRVKIIAFLGGIASIITFGAPYVERIFTEPPIIHYRKEVKKSGLVHAENLCNFGNGLRVRCCGSR